MILYAIGAATNLRLNLPVSLSAAQLAARGGGDVLLPDGRNLAEPAAKQVTSARLSFFPFLE